MAQALAFALYAAAAVCLCGVSRKVWVWARTPEPFRIPTTTGQQPSIPAIRPSRVESPSTRAGAAARVFVELLLFRSLFRNIAPAPSPASVLCPPPVFLERKALWLGALAFHYALLVTVVRHLRLFVEPVPGAVTALAAADGFFEIGVPRLYASDVILAVALAYLLARRLRDPLLRYLSLPADYLALGTLLTVAASGMLLRYVVRVDLTAVRGFTLGLPAFAPGPLPGMSAWLAVHLAAVAFLLAILPFTKLMHAAGAWLSPTRNQPNDSRRRRHVNPWNAPVPVHGYAAWQAEFRDKLAVAGLPIDGEPPAGGAGA